MATFMISKGRNNLDGLEPLSYLGNECDFMNYKLEDIDPKWSEYDSISIRGDQLATKIGLPSYVITFPYLTKSEFGILLDLSNQTRAWVTAYLRDQFEDEWIYVNGIASIDHGSYTNNSGLYYTNVTFTISNISEIV